MDIALLMHREYYYDKTAYPHGCEIIMAKNRSAGQGSFELKYELSTGRFSDMSQFDFLQKREYESASDNKKGRFMNY